LLGKAGAPLPWRCHAPPDAPEVEGLNAKLEALGVNIRLPLPSSRTQGESDSDHLSNLLGAWADISGGNIKISNEDNNESDVDEYLQGVLNSEARNNILDSLADAQKEASELDDVVRRVVDQGLFQLMQRATYNEVNLGHFGLNLDAYVHFTSPIRRYPDLMAHRQLKSYLRGTDWAHSLEETADLAVHCSDQGYKAKRLEWELVANAYHLHLLRGGEIGDGLQSDGDSTPLEGKSWPARIVGLRTPWVFLDLADDGSIQGRMHLRQISGKIRTVIDEHGLEVVPAEPDERGQQNAIVKLGQKFPCRLRGLDVWSGSLDLAPIR
jgi:exoribonuclease R